MSDRLRHLSGVQLKGSQYWDKVIQDVFLSGLISDTIHQWLLEIKTLDLSTTFDQARVLSNKNGKAQSHTLLMVTLMIKKENIIVAVFKVLKYLFLNKTVQFR